MAKHKGRRRNSKFQALNVSTTITIGALADAVVVSGSLTGLGTTRFRVVSADLMWAQNGHTSPEGPMIVGIFNGDLSNTEVGEALDAIPTSQSDIIAIERTRRPVRRAGVFSGQNAVENLYDGRMKRVKLHTVLNEGVELKAFARNASGATFTTGTLLEVTGTVYGFWI